VPQGPDHAKNDMIIIGSQESGLDVQLWRSRLMTTAGAEWHDVASNVLLGICIVVMAHSRAQHRLTRVQTCRIATGQAAAQSANLALFAVLIMDQQ
jgi:hypothetical protein